MDRRLLSVFCAVSWITLHSAGPAMAAAPATTRPATTRLSPDLNRQSIAQLRQAIEANYSYRDLRKVDWDRLFSGFSDRLENADSPRAFAIQATSMLSAARDVHVWLKWRDEGFATFAAQGDANYRFELLTKLVPIWREHNGTLYLGRFPDGVGFVLITTWDPDRLATLEPVYILLANPRTKSIIIDVRMNWSGDESLAAKLAGCFIGAPKVYAKNTFRKDGQWQGPYDRVLEPSKSRPKYPGKVAVLMGPHTLECGEDFVLMMKAAGATLFGTRSFGSSGHPQPVALANGVTVYLPSWQDLRPDGTCFEGQGIAPDVEVKTQRTDFTNADPVLDAARKFLGSTQP